MSPTDAKLESSPASVREARRFVRQSLQARHIRDDVTATVELLTSEVVTNAIVHAGTPCELAVAIQPDRVRVEVLDASGAIPIRIQGPVDAISGRGLQIVERLALRWGCERRSRAGKRVWFEVAR